MKKKKKNLKRIKRNIDKRNIIDYYLYERGEKH